MLCYMDKTFCTGDGCLKFNRCGRALTDNVNLRAQAAQLPISYTEGKDMVCYETACQVETVAILQKLADEEQGQGQLF